jgi:hypothetical protein
VKYFISFSFKCCGGVEMVKNATGGSNDSLSPEDLKRLLDLVKTVRYGSVTLVIQDGKVIQIDKNEKMRLR